MRSFSVPAWLVLCGLACYCTLTSAQLVSPCPRLFYYETNNTETDRWYGVLTLQTDVELTGVWLRIALDKPTQQLGNWFGQVERRENNEYLVKNPQLKLQPNTPTKVRFYVKYTPGETPPRVTGYRLNARTLCPEGGTTTAAPVTEAGLLTSSWLGVTPSSPVAAQPQPQQQPQPVLGGVDGSAGNSAVRPGGVFTIPRPLPADDDDFFQGDFSLLNRPPGAAANFEPACGTVIAPPRPLITHGQPTHEGEYPWHAALYHARGIDLTYICGGSLITRYHIITVAHCVTRRRSQLPLDTGTLVIYLGKYYLKRWSSKGVQDKHVQQIIPHPKYDSTTFHHDIAILRLSEPAEITAYVRPVCLWEGDSDLQKVVGREGVVVGWGFDETGKVTEQLTKASMPIVSQETCIYSFPDFFSRFTSKQTFCAGFKNGTSVCNGDSGGGMVFPRQSSNNMGTIWHLRGLVSISVALQNQFRCDSSHYVVFTDVGKYLDWIQANLK